MNKLLLITLTIFSLYAQEIALSQVKMESFSPSLELNSKIVQLSNAKQSITSLVGGHIEKYYVSQASRVKSGDKVALISSMDLSKMSAEYISLKKQYRAKIDTYRSTKKLYAKGMTSKKELNEQSIEKDLMLSQINSLKSQLKALDIDAKRLSKASSTYIIHAHMDGTVSEVLQPLHSSVSKHTPLLNIVSQEGYYLQSFIPLEYAQEIKLGQKIVFKYASLEVETEISQILPELDKNTQRIVVLSLIPKSKNHYFINSYVSSRVYFSRSNSYKSVEKTALSFFNNEWVVFVPKHSDEEHENHESEHEHDEDEHEEYNTHEEHNEHEESGYEPRVIKIITQNENFVAIDGLDFGEEYVSEHSYYVKSFLLKSALGGHGH